MIFFTTAANDFTDDTVWKLRLQAFSAKES
jgi:hypothetical protein